MDVDLHLFDEDGDMLLLLAQSVPMIQSNNDIDKLVESEEVPFNVHLQVSSKHMILASSVFKAMLQRNGFKEGCTLASTGAVEVPLPDDRPEAFITILDIIHGRTRKVPRKIELDMLTKIAVLVDKYSFHEAVEMFSDMWVARLDPPWKKGRDGEKLDIFPDLIETDILCSWLTISWVFGKADLFREATKYAQLYTTNTFGDPGHFDLPFPDPAIESIKSSRAQCLQAMYDIVDRYIRIYQDKSTLQCTQGPIEARWACNAWLSEALIEGNYMLIFRQHIREQHQLWMSEFRQWWKACCVTSSDTLRRSFVVYC